VQEEEKEKKERKILNGENENRREKLRGARTPGEPGRTRINTDKHEQTRTNTGEKKKRKRRKGLTVGEKFVKEAVICLT